MPEIYKRTGADGSEWIAEALYFRRLNESESELHIEIHLTRRATLEFDALHLNVYECESISGTKDEAIAHSRKVLEQLGFIKE